jgi:hypothetical protein
VKQNIKDHIDATRMDIILAARACVLNSISGINAFYSILNDAPPAPGLPDPVTTLGWVRDQDPFKSIQQGVPPLTVSKYQSLKEAIRLL